MPHLSTNSTNISSMKGYTLVLILDRPLYRKIHLELGLLQGQEIFIKRDSLGACRMGLNDEIAGRFRITLAVLNNYLYKYHISVSIDIFLLNSQTLKL
jgi:hypothetical protein